MQNNVSHKSPPIAGPVSRFASIFRRKRRPIATGAPVARIEGLESRALLSGGPTLTGVEMQGSVGAVTGIVLTFSEPLNTATAQNVDAYAFGKAPVPNSSSNSGFSIGDIFAFRYPNHPESAAATKQMLVKKGKIQMASAVYDSTADTVTLTPFAPFKAQNYLRFLRIKGIGPNTIDDTLGNPLNGGKDTVAQWTLHQGRTIKYHDANGDHVTLKLTGPGKLYVFTRHSKDTQPTIFLQGASSATTLNGIVTNRGHILPVVNIEQIQGALGITDNLLNNPMFDVAATT
ncbi:MAG TPA: hypothetical protein VFE47_26885 [Tepidisphaeraceae bacterium]|jgi:hypothetical protein|nr:hypothetical protein [Tepidisphaeraceae bacterium]